MNLIDIVAIYRIEKYEYYKPATADNKIIQTWLVFDSHDEYFDTYLGFYRNLPDFTQLIVHAVDGTFKVTNKGISEFIKHNHQKVYVKDDKQFGVHPDVLLKVRNNLIKEIDGLQVSKTFDELFEIVSKAKEKGFGNLSIYDTAVRIASYLAIEPDKVFLHAGALTGMRILEQKGYVPPGVSDALFVKVEQLPLELRDFKPIITEHFLCSQKDKLNLLPDVKLLN